MNQIVASVLMGYAMAKQVQEGEENLRLKDWVDPESLSGGLLFLVIVWFLYLGVSAVNDIAVPQYQLRAKDEKKKEEQREWSMIWGNIEK